MKRTKISIINNELGGDQEFKMKGFNAAFKCVVQDFHEQQAVLRISFARFLAFVFPGVRS